MPPVESSVEPTNPIVAVQRLFATATRQRGADLSGARLRIYEIPTTEVDDDADRSERPAGELVSPFDLGRTYELLLAPKARQRKGAHLTPEHVARQLVALMPAPNATDAILDPAVGGAAFLLAAADRLVAAGASPETALGQLHGFDIDPGAVAVAEAALTLWGLDHGVEPEPLLNLVVGDGLLDALPEVNQVVGNPPFLNQLRSSSTHTATRRNQLRQRWGDLVGTYTDDAWLFVAAGLAALHPGGSLAMVQPVSILAARDAEAVRRLVHNRSSLAALWVARDRVFDAAVHVCGLVIEGEPQPARKVTRRVGADFTPVVSLETQPKPNEWGSAAAGALDVPRVSFGDRRRGVAGDLAAATAGFRDQFYGFVPHVSEGTSESPSAEFPRLVTVGMIDVLGLGWGQREFRFAKQRFVRPVVDLRQLRSTDPALAEWTNARSRPKLLLATQTRVVELWVDTDGRAVPATPVVSIEPHDDDAETLWLLAAALSAPALSAWFLASKLGTAMSLNSMKLAARDVLAAPLPMNRRAWEEAAAIIRTEPDSLAEYAGLMGDAYGVNDPALQAWWLARATNRSKTR